MPSLLMPPKAKLSLPQKSKIPRKPKLLRSNPARLSYLANGDSFGFLIDDEDILTGYRINTNARRTARDEPNDDDDGVELSDYVQFRLWLARQLALMKYQEKWG